MLHEHVLPYTGIAASCQIKELFDGNTPKAEDIEEPSISFPFLLAACESQGGRKSSGVKHNIGGFPLL